jgi:hypothetical protein
MIVINSENLEFVAIDESVDVSNIAHPLPIAAFSRLVANEPAPVRHQEVCPIAIA